MTPRIEMNRSLVFPPSAVTQTFGFVGRKGSGKTYAAGRFVEQLYGVGGPFAVLDPVGNWWGLRLARDGKSPGIPVPVLGGEHGDLELHPGSGAQVAIEMMERSASLILDVSQFRRAQRKEFVCEFVEELFHASKSRQKPHMIIFEEAQVFAPQRSGREDERMLAAVEDVVRLGRNYGLGSSLITQRPQSVHKDVLNQIECLLVGQLNAVHERKAVEDWIRHRGAKMGFVDELPSLSVGEMVLWSPQWLNKLQKVKIGQKSTYDSSSTPVLGQDRRELALHPVDVTAFVEAVGSPKSDEGERCVCPECGDEHTRKS